MDLLEEMRGKNFPINDYEKLTKIEKEILEIIIENPEITQVNIANRLGTAPKTVQRGEIALNLEISSRLIFMEIFCLYLKNIN